MANLSFAEFRTRVKNETLESAESLSQLPWNLKQFYADWISQTHWFVCHSTRLLCLMASYMSVKNDRIHLRSLDHLSEERSHERLAKSDLQKLGFSLSDFPERPSTSAFYQSQYYLIERVHPLSLFGYIIYLEGLAVHAGPFIAKIALENYGKECTSFLKLHSEEDVSHIEKALKELESLDQETLGFIYQSFSQSRSLYESMVRDISKGSAGIHETSTTGIGIKANRTVGLESA